MDLTSKKVWLVGTGNIGIEYAKVLKNLGCDLSAIGRGKEKSEEFEKKTGIPAITGGLSDFLLTNPNVPDYAVVTVGIEALSDITIQLIKYGVKYILLEKPGVGNFQEIYKLCDLAFQYNSSIFIAYNRRFYASVQMARQVIEQDGGLTSIHFEFTEWSHQIEALIKHKTEHENWFLGNSTHVVDTAFYLAGKPTEMCSFVRGQGSLNWHPSSSIFTGAGVTEKGALFSYHANWKSPGRWSIDVCTPKHRLIFRPMETLQIQKIGSVSVENVKINDALDTEFKPGLFKQVQAFFNHEFEEMVDLSTQKELIEKFYLKMSGYK